MVTLRKAASDATTIAICGLLSAGDRAADYVNKAISSLPGVGQPYDPNINDAFKRMVCPAGAVPSPVAFPQPPFAGGQCPIIYLVTVTLQTYNVFGEAVAPFTTENTIYGPISSVAIEPDPSNSAAIALIIRGRFSTGALRVVTTAYNNQPKASRVEILNINVAPQNASQPDSCGSLPTPPGNPTASPNITYNRDGTEVTVPVGIVFLPPIIGINGNLSIPLTFTGPDFSLNPVFNFADGSVNFNLNLGDRTGAGCEPPLENPTIPPDPDDLDGQPERFFRAMIVVSSGNLNNTTATEVSAGQGVSLFVPRLGTLSMRIRIGAENAWLPDISIKHTRQLVIVPENFVANGYAAQPIAGVSFALYPVYLKNYNAPDQ